MAKRIDLTGHKYNMLTVLSLSDRTENGKVYWNCLCDCGNESAVIATALRQGNTKSCGCTMRHKEITGNIYHEWAVLEPILIRGKPSQRYICRCSCGTTKTVRRRELLSGLSKSCGCKVKLPDGGAARNSLCLIYKASAKKRGITWNLSREIFDQITKESCRYCGLRPQQILKTSTCSTYIYNGIDRVDNARGYEPFNVVPCCKTCNSAKNVMGEEEFAVWIDRVHRRFAKERFRDDDDFIYTEDGEGGWVQCYKEVKYIPIEEGVCE